jgi:hypothetical protein
MIVAVCSGARFWQAKGFGRSFTARGVDSGPAEPVMGLSTSQMETRFRESHYRRVLSSAH